MNRVNNRTSVLRRVGCGQRRLCNLPDEGGGRGAADGDAEAERALARVPRRGHPPLRQISQQENCQRLLFRYFQLLL